MAERLRTLLDTVLFCGTAALAIYSWGMPEGGRNGLRERDGFIFFIGWLVYPFLVEAAYWVLCPRRLHEFTQLLGDRLPLVYRESYNITAGGLESLHPFDSQKYRRVRAALLDAGVVTPAQFVQPPMLSYAELRLGHPSWYIASLGYSSLTGCYKLEVPPAALLPSFLLRWRVLEPMLYQSKGTLVAAQLALKHGWAVNLGGGFHHCSCTRGGGFCPIADISIALKFMRAVHGLRRIMIVDLDAHQGNGHERDFLGDSDVYILDVYNPYIYPNDTRAKRAISSNILYHEGDKGPRFLAELEAELVTAVNEFRPEMVLYNAGTDCLEGDPLGNLDLTPQAIASRDELVFRVCLGQHPSVLFRTPVAMMFSGGYQPVTANVIAASLLNLNKKFRLFRKGDPSKSL